MYLFLPLIGILLTSYNLLTTSLPSQYKCLNTVNRNQHNIVSSSALFANKSPSVGKGFGKSIKQEPPVEQDTATAVDNDNSSLQSASFNDESGQQLRIPRRSSPIIPNTQSTNIESGNVDELIQSTDMFKKKRQNRIDILNENIQKLKEEEDLIATDPSVGAVPELVANRMLGRIIVFFGIPVFGGLAIFVGSFFAFKKYDISVPPYIIAYATQFPFVLGLLGITYAILSSSWDEEPGSALGIDEFKLNFKRIQDGLSRTRDNAALREDIEKESEALNRGGRSNNSNSNNNNKYK